MVYMGVSRNMGTPKSSILMGFSITNHPFWGTPFVQVAARVVGLPQWGKMGI